MSVITGPLSPNEMKAFRYWKGQERRPHVRAQNNVLHPSETIMFEHLVHRLRGDNGANDILSHVTNAQGCVESMKQYGGVAKRYDIVNLLK